MWRGMPDAPEGTQSTQSACSARSVGPVGQRSGRCRYVAKDVDVVENDSDRPDAETDEVEEVSLSKEISARSQYDAWGPCRVL